MGLFLLMRSIEENPVRSSILLFLLMINHFLFRPIGVVGHTMTLHQFHMRSNPIVRPVKIYVLIRHHKVLC